VAGTNAYGVRAPSSFVADDRVITAPQTRGASCTLTLDHVASVAGTSVTVTTGVARVIGDILFNLGQVPKVAAYAIRRGNLTACDYIANDCGNAANNGSAAVWVPIANNIVSLRAQYGRDTTATMDGIVDVYDQTTPPAATLATGCNWARISAVRLALVARSAQFEKTAVTTAAPVWDGSSADNPAGSAASPVDLSGNASWQNYRYKVFQTVVPIRNISWMGVVSGC
jgi:type IV pilus assembly protein PilW